MFTAAVFTIAKLWKQPDAPRLKNGFFKMWYISTTEFYSAIKMNEIMLFADKWLKLENIMLSEGSQLKNSKAICFPSHVEVRHIS
jgi:hypothetical protein